MSTRNSLVPSNGLSNQSPEYQAILSTAKVNKQAQINSNGLIILRALYGDLVEIGEEVPSTQYRPGKCIDVSMELQGSTDALNGSLVLVHAAPLHQRVPDIINPNAHIKNKLIKNRLAVTYYFQGELHFALFKDDEQIILPMPDHQCGAIIDNGEYPDVQATWESVTEWAKLLPTEDDDNFYIFGTNWDLGHKYQNESHDYKELLSCRPENIFCEPRFLVYERQLRIEESKERQKLLLGFGAAGVAIAAIALQLTGIVDFKTLLFGTTTQISTTTTTASTTPTTAQHQQHHHQQQQQEHLQQTKQAP